MNPTFDGLISSASLKWGVPFEWIKAVIGTESNFDPGAYRYEPHIDDASFGLMQILTETARGLGFTGSDEELFEPAVNIDLGAKLLAQLRASYGSFKRVYSAYNSGRPDLWETSSQVARNVARAEEWLARVIAESPALAATGGAGLLILLALGLWYFVKRG